MTKIGQAQASMSFGEIYATSVSISNNISTYLAMDGDGAGSFLLGTDIYGVPSGVKALTAGFYLITASGYWTANYTGKRTAAIMVGNDSDGFTAVARRQQSANDNGYTYQSFSAMVYMKANDSARLYVVQNSGSALTFYSPRLAIVRIDAPGIGATPATCEADKALSLIADYNATALAFANSAWSTPDTQPNWTESLNFLAMKGTGARLTVPYKGIWYLKATATFYGDSAGTYGERTVRLLTGSGQEAAASEPANKNPDGGYYFATVTAEGIFRLPASDSVRFYTRGFNNGTTTYAVSSDNWSAGDPITDLAACYLGDCGGW